MSHDLSPLGFRKNPRVDRARALPARSSAQVAAALTEAVQERSAALIAPAGTKTVALRMLVAALETRFQVHVRPLQA